MMMLITIDEVFLDKLKFDHQIDKLANAIDEAVIIIKWSSINNIQRHLLLLEYWIFY